MSVQLKGATGDGDNFAGICGPRPRFEAEATLFSNIGELIGVKDTDEYTNARRKSWGTEVVQMLIFARDYSSQLLGHANSEHIRNGKDQARAASAWHMVVDILTEGGANPDEYEKLKDFCNYFIPTFEAIRKNVPMGKEQIEKARDFCRKAADWWYQAGEERTPWFPTIMDLEH